MRIPIKKPVPFIYMYMHTYIISPQYPRRLLLVGTRITGGRETATAENNRDRQSAEGKREGTAFLSFGQVDPRTGGFQVDPGCWVLPYGRLHITASGGGGGCFLR